MDLHRRHLAAAVTLATMGAATALLAQTPPAAVQGRRTPSDLDVRRAIRAGLTVVVDARAYKPTLITAFARDCAKYGGRVRLSNAGRLDKYYRQRLTKDSAGLMTFDG